VTDWKKNRAAAKKGQTTYKIVRNTKALRMLPCFRSMNRSCAQLIILIAVAPLALGAIPAVITQIWRTNRHLTGIMAESSHAWRTLNPEYRYLLYNHTEARALVEQVYPTALAVYDALPQDVMRADLFRYIALFAHGGVYADIDTVPLLPLREWVLDRYVNLHHQIRCI
jgi:mannosyltransferase OCH1-like enzyme